MNGVKVYTPESTIFIFTFILLAWLLTACGGSDDSSPVGENDLTDNTNPPSISEPVTFTIGGNVTGLTGTGLVLQNNAADSLTITSNGSFTFSTSVVDGDSYNVTVSTQPSEQSCSVKNGSGTLQGANVVNVEVYCGLAVTVSSSQPKVLTFSWADVGAHHYKLLKNPDGISGYMQLGTDILATSVEEEISVHLHDWVNASYIVQSCDISNVCTDSAEISSASAMINAIGYVKASNTETLDFFGYSVALSADGLTLAIAANRESSHADVIDGDQLDNTGGDAGAVYVFVRTGTVWSQQAYIKASNSGIIDYFGTSLAISADGNTLVVGAYGEGSADGNQADNTADYAGAVYVFGRSGSTWTQHAYLKASNIDGGDYFGYSLALSDDGNTLAVGAYREASAATGINGNQADNTALYSGAVYVFDRTSLTTWNQQAYLKASNSEAGDYFGLNLALSNDGNTLAISSEKEASAAVGINSDETDNSAPNSGAVYVFQRSGTSWSQQAYIKASNTEADDIFGSSLAISNDGNTLAVGAFGEDSVATGFNGNELDNSAIDSGALYVFVRSGSSWSQQGYVKASNTQSGDVFGGRVAMTADGNTLAVGARSEKSTATGINGNEWDDGYSSGAVYYFIRGGTSWAQKTYIKASNTDTSDGFGRSIALSADGSTLVVGADGEQSSATGINGNQNDDSLTNAGAVYLY